MSIPLADHYSWTDGDDIILQDGPYVARIHVDDLVDLWDHANSIDSGKAKHAGRYWDRDHLAGAVNLAVNAGLLRACREAGPWGECERPVTDINETRCRVHRRYA